MKEKDRIVYDKVAVQAKDYQAALTCAARQVIRDHASRQLFLDGAGKEVCQALSVVHALSLGDDCLDGQSVKESEIPLAISDLIGEEGILQKVARLCKDNGLLPYYSIGILVYALLTKEAAVFQDYADYYGLKAAIIKCCGLRLESELAQLIAGLHVKIGSGRTDPPEKIALMKDAYYQGFKNEQNYKGCAQCTLLTMFNLFGRENAGLFQSASALSAGMAHSGDGPCGGYSGGVMYLGTIIGRRLDHLEDGDKEAKNKSYRLAQMLRDRFIATYGSVICSGVHQEIFGQSIVLPRGGQALIVRSRQQTMTIQMSSD